MMALITLNINGKKRPREVDPRTQVLWVLRDHLADHPVQKAWHEHDVAQCGYCQAGQIMSAAALLNKSPNTTDAEIEAAMDGNICRCGPYVRIKETI